MNITFLFYQISPSFVTNVFILKVTCWWLSCLFYEQLLPWWSLWFLLET